MPGAVTAEPRDLRVRVSLGGGIISAFTQPTLSGEARASVLLLSFECAAGLNLQTCSHNVVLYAPLFSRSDPVAAVAKEQQAMGRVWRYGQTHDVTVHRLVLEGPRGEDSVDRLLIARNTDPTFLQQASNL